MREIKFRVWSNDLNKMVYPDDKGWFQNCFTGNNQFYQTCSLGVVIDKNGKELELMQFIGLKDSDEKEIYESDVILKVTTGSLFEVYYSETSGCYRVKRQDGWHFDLQEIFPINDWKVVGNIYEKFEWNV